MSDTAQSTAPNAADESKATPEHPWGEDFDAARAWETITRQREAEKDYKAKLAAFEKAEQDRADADKSELEKLQARLAKAEADTKAANRAAVLAKSGLPEKLHGFITADSDEEIAKQIADLTAALGASDKGKDADEEGQKPDSNGRPQPGLTPGHGGDDKPAVDLDAIVAANR